MIKDLSSLILYGAPFDLDRLAIETPPTVPVHLLPWLIKDRREAVDGCMVNDRKTGELVHDRSGLDYAEKEARSFASKLLSPKLSEDMRALLTIQLANAETKAAFYRGKIYLLDRIIGITHAARAAQGTP